MRNPLEAGWTRGQAISFVLYAIFTAASVWATGESIWRTTLLPRTFCYIIGLAALLGAATCLMLIKQAFSPGYEPRRALLAIVGFIGFLFLWFVSLTSNTHNFYFVMAADDLRREEAATVQSALNLLRDKALVAGDAARESFREELEALILKMKAEITNPGDPGHSVETEKVIAQIEALLQREVQRLDRPGTGMSGWEVYANSMADQVRSLSDTRMREIDSSLASISAYLERPKYGAVLTQVSDALDQGIHNMEILDLKELLRTAFSTYNEAVDLVKQGFELPELARRSTLSLQELPSVPGSIRLENIASSWKDFLSGKFETWKFWLSLLWAITLDVAAFILFYFGVLRREDSYA